MHGDSFWMAGLDSQQLLVRYTTGKGGGEMNNRLTDPLTDS